MVDNTLTTMTQITVYLPETGTKTFRSVVATAVIPPIGTATGAITSRNIQCRLGAAAYTSNSNANATTTSGEDVTIPHAVDLTSHFTTNWTGTSMTFDTQLQVDGTWTNVSFANVTVTLSITYDYDDTSTTQIKTVRIPLNAPVGALATTKPGTATATLPLLNTDLPEASKVFRSQHIVLEALSSGVDQTITMQLDTTAAHTSGTWEGAAATDMRIRYVWDCSAVLDEATAMGFYLYGSTAEFAHCQVTLVVTYEFDASAANDVWVSLLLPASNGGLAGAAAADYQRLTATLDIPEAGVVSKQMAFYANWATTGVSAGLNMRAFEYAFGAGSFVAYTDTAAMVAGNACAMVRNDTNMVVARGHNILCADVYETETTTDLVGMYTGYFIVNYTCDKPTGGHGAVTTSVRRWIEAPYAGASIIRDVMTAMAPVINESDYYVTNVGAMVDFYANAAQQGFGAHIEVERLAAEGGVAWDQISGGAATADFRTGICRTTPEATHLFKQFPGDLRVGKPNPRRDLETSRRWRVTNLDLVAMWDSASIWYTYHSQTWTVSGTVSGSAGGTVTITLHDAATHEPLKSTTRVGNGSYSMTWYDPVKSLYVTARESDTLTMRTGNGVAT
jgi:hypothetical protein